MAILHLKRQWSLRCQTPYPSQFRNTHATYELKQLVAVAADLPFYQRFSFYAGLTSKDYGKNRIV